MWLTICVPTYNNTKEQLTRLFTSLCGINAEILVLADTDNRDYINLVSSCVYDCHLNAKVISGKNKGLFNARRTLVKNCFTSWLFFVDADDYVTQDFVSFVNSWTPSAKYDVYKTKCECLGERNNFKNRAGKKGCSDVESGDNSLMWGKFIKTKVLKETYDLLPSYPCGLFYGEEVPQTFAFKVLKSKLLNIKTICYTDEGATSIKVIDSIEAWRKLLSIVYLVDWYGTKYIQAVLISRMKLVDVSISKQAISLYRRAMHKAEKAEQIFREKENDGQSVHDTALQLFGNSDPLNFAEVLCDDIERNSTEE